MRNRKRVFAQFTFHDRTGIQNYLEKMALKGWMLDKITKWSWHFRRIEPRRVHFAVSYFAKTSSFEPEPPEELLRFRDFCEHTGWRFCAEAAQMQIFFNEAEAPVPIETDAMLEIESIHRSVKKQLLPSYILIGAVAVLNGGMRISELVKYPIVFLRSNLNLFVMLSVLCLFLMCAAELGSYFLWRHRALKAAERDGSFVPTRGNRTLVLALLYLLLAAFVLLIVSEWNGSVGKIFLIAMGYYFALLLIVHGASDIMKRKKVGAATNVTVTVILSFVLSFALVGVMSWMVTRLDGSDFFEEKKEEYVLAPEEEYYSSTGRLYTAQHHSLPFYATDFYDHDVPADVYSDYHYVESSMLLTHHECGSRVRYDYDNSSPNSIYENLSYNIYDLHLGLLADPIMDNLLSKYEHRRYDNMYYYEKRDASLWKADEVYELECSNPHEELDSYTIRWGNRIVQLALFDAPTEEQISMIVERLAP